MLALTPGQAADIKMLPIVLDAVPAPRELLADKAYDGDALREWLIARGTTPVIPNNDRRVFLHPFNPKRYKTRNAIERMF